MKSSHSTPQPLGAQILDWAREGKIEQIEECWLEQVAALPNQSAFYKEWIKLLRRTGAQDRAEALLVLVLEDRLETHKVKTALRILLAVIPSFPRSEVLRPLLVKTLRAFYADLEQLEPILKLSDLAGSAALTEGFQSFQEWYRLTPGQVYQHYDWGEGVVQELDLAAGKVTLLFADELSKVMTIEGVRKYLKYIEPTHFLARRAKDPDSLSKQADSEPAEVVKLALASQPAKQLKQSELKSLLTPILIPAEQWNSWWSRTREALKLDPFVDFDSSGGAHTVIQLREKPLTFEEEIERRFFAEDAGTALKAEMIRQLAKRSREAAVPLKLARRMLDRLQEDWKLAQGSGPASRLEIAYMLQDLGDAMPEANVQAPEDGLILAQIRDYSVLFEMDNMDYASRALIKLLARDGEAGCRQAADLLPHAPVKLAQAIWMALGEEHHFDMAVNALQKLFNEPLNNPETYAWAARATLDGSWKYLEEYFPPASAVPDLLAEMEGWQRLVSDGGPTERVNAAKALLTRMRTLLGANKFDILARAVLAMSREAANRLRHQIQVHGALPPTFKSQAERIILLTRKDLEETAPKVDDTHYCTQRAYTEKAQELRLITSTKIPKNSKVIEEARMEGDLRENAGYQYAKEEQKMLVQQQASLSELLARARIVQKNEIDPATIGFGTRMRVQNLKTDQEEDYTILGRWEANPERHILSMQAPLAQQFIGHRVGETVEIQHPGGGSTQYKVLEITNALASGEWESENSATPAG